MSQPRVRSSGFVAFACRLALIAAIGLAAHGLAAASLRFQGLAMLLLGVIVWRKLRRGRTTDDHGSARTASMVEVEKAGLLADDGLLLGRCLPETPSLPAAIGGLIDPHVRSDTACRGFFAATYGNRWRSEQLIRTNNYVHLATFSPAGGGKGIAALIPNLLSYPGNCVIVDTKGELFAAAAEHRRKRFGKKIYRLDPFGVCGPGGDTLNPFQYIDEKKEDFLDRVRAFANPLIIRQPDEKQPHFNDMAELMLIALSAFVCGCQHDRERRHLGTVRGIAASRDIYFQAVELMQKTEAGHGVIKRLAGQLSFPAAEEQGSIFSTFARQTQFLDSLPVARNVAASSFDPLELKTGNADLYLILPHDMLVPLQRLQRLWINTVMGRITSGKPDESRRVLWLLDEMAHIGRMQAIEDAVTLYRGMGIRLWFIFQSLGQLKTTFGEKAPTILDNIGSQQYFGINSYETAEEISKRIGTATIGTVSANSSTSSSRPTGGQGEGGNVSTSSGVTHNEIGRRLLLPEEVLTLPDDITLIFHKNLPVIPARLVKYFEAPEFKNGGTAAPRRLGFAAVLLAAFTLFAGNVFTAVALKIATMPLPASMGRGQRMGQGPAYWRSQPGRPLRRMPTYRQPPRRRGPSGFLGKI
jgi:type IV secretion system protein VirD4